MAKTYEEINEIVNRLAKELSAQNPADINTNYVKELQRTIWELLNETYYKKPKKIKKNKNNKKSEKAVKRNEYYEYDEDGNEYNDYNNYDGENEEDEEYEDEEEEQKYERYDKYGNEVIYYALVRRDVPHDVFTDVTINLLGVKKDGQWAYNPEKGSFITAFKRKLEYKLIDYYNEMQKKSALNPSKFDSLDDTAAKEDSRLLHETIKDNRAEMPYHEVINKIVGIGDIIDRYKKLRTEQSEKEAEYYEGFFTFDTVEVIKSDKDKELGIIACEYNDELFPLLLVSLLEYLMIGSFAQIADVLKNPLRPNINLRQRGEIIENFFGISHPTQNKFSQKYEKIRKTIVGEWSKIN